MPFITRLTLTLCLILLSVCTGGAQEASYYLQGTVGSYPIAMRISCFEDSSCSDTRYYYKKVLKDIVLEGRRNGKHFILHTSEYNKEAVSETFDLRQQQDEVFTGTWTSGNKKLPVKLAAIKISAIHHPYQPVKEISKEAATDAYEYLRSSLLTFVRDSVTKHKNKELVWFHEKKSSFSFFRLGNGFSALQLQKINPLLEAIQLENAMSQLSCSSPWGGSIDFTVDVSYLDNNLLAFHIFASWSCGGAHPDFGGTGYLLELNTGRRFDIDDILAFDASVTTEARSGFDKYSQYRSDFFAPKIMALMSKAHGFEAPKSEDDCDYTDVDIWDFPSWRFTPEGIAFTPIFARVMRACENEFLLPFDQLQAYKNPAFPYKFPGKQP